ncbi:hypothetical protein PI23P_06645 [Polaribacter irgensii 23-P]|uniref:Uncharacterized protein n=1 Tax=Polaribacter irgensii 23-P TaxID=313594 RepID=A4BYN8_9FLAO|nr:hypothetical protein PI23P_06645 [Polaribacter irgensii 23-P]
MEIRLFCAALLKAKTASMCFIPYFYKTDRFTGATHPNCF